MKRFFAIALALCFVLAFAGCAEKADNNTAADNTDTGANVVVENNENDTEDTDTEEVVVMSYADYVAAELDTEVTVECYVQDHQSWWDNKITAYAQDEDGAYFFYEMACSEEDAAKLVPGTKIRATGYKSEWAGEVEIIDATFEIIEGSYIAEAFDVTELLGTDELIAHQNKFVAFKGMTVASAPLYKWDGSGTDGDDLYFDVSINDATYTFTVESYLRGAGTEVYEAVKALNVGDVIDLEGFLYWYEGVNPHITSVTVVKAAPKVLSYAEYIAADADTEVVIEAYVQNKQAYAADYGNTSLYLQDQDGGYFVYRIPCTAEDYEKFAIGSKLKITGFKSEWSGEVEIVDATFEIVEGSYIAEAFDVTELLGTDELIAHQNEFVAFKGMTVEAANDAGDAFLYNWDGSGEDGNDLYFNVSLNGENYSFVVESDLCGAGTEVYEAVKALNVGDVIDLEGFLYWYEGANPHITSVAAAQ